MKERNTSIDPIGEDRAFRPIAVFRAVTTVVIATFGSVACADLTNVEDPDVLQPESLESAAGARALRAGAITRFSDAFSGGGTTGFGRGQITQSGTMADEFIATHLNDNADKRSVDDPDFEYTTPFIRGSEARISFLEAVKAAEEFTPDARGDIGEMYALVGYIEIWYGSDMCSGIPLSSIEDGKPVFGQPLTTVEMLEQATADFDLAATYATADPDILNLTRVGKARALLLLGRYSEAAAAVAAVPTDFSYETEHSASSQQNGVYGTFYVSESWSVSDAEGGNGLDFVTAGDPRVQTEYIGEGYDGTVPTYGLKKYTSFSSPIVLASGIEARLIEAEAELQGGDAAGALAILNDLRTMEPGLAPVTLQGTEAAQVDQIFRERAFWLFATGQRLGDLRRLIRQYGREQESVFPTGPYRAGILYGNSTTFTAPADEYNNPNFDGCLNRNP